MYRHVIWDLGGTLVDTYPALDRTLAAVVRDAGGQVSEAEVARLTRRSTGEAIAALSSRFGIDEAAFRAAEAELKRRWEEYPPPAMPGARELLRDVASAGGLNLVVTHRERSSAESLIAGLGLRVDDLISAVDGHPRKPDPSMFTAMLARHRLSADDCLAVGDRPIDAVAARAAGVTAATLESAAAPVDDDARYSVEGLVDLRPLLGLAAPGGVAVG